MTTVESILFGDRGNAVRCLKKSIATSGDAIQRLGLRFAFSGSDVARAIALSLETQVGDLAAEAWADCDEVRQACRRTDGRRGARELVRLLDHTATSTQDIDVEVKSGGKRQTIMTMTLRVSVKVNAVTVMIEAGRVAGFRPGSASASAALSIGDVEVASGSMKDVSLGLGSGSRRRAA